MKNDETSSTIKPIVPVSRVEKTSRVVLVGPEAYHSSFDDD